MDISVVVPLYNEEESLPELYAWIHRVMQANGFSYEVIFVDEARSLSLWTPTFRTVLTKYRNFSA